MNKWHPKVRTGFFYVGDAQFYLFADKKTAWLDDITWYVYDTGIPVHQITQAKYGTYDIDTECLKIEGNHILINLRFLNPRGHIGYSTVNIYEHEVMVSYTYLTGTDRLQQTEVENVIFHPSQADRKYYLDPIPVNGPPVILSNLELSSRVDDEYLYPQFSINYETGELKFLSHGHRNLLNNSLFACTHTYSGETYPTDWLTKTDDKTRVHTIMQKGYIGRHSYLLGNIIAGDGIYTSVTQAELQYTAGDHIRQNWLYQEVPLGTAENLSLSLYAKASHPEVAEVPDISNLYMKILFLNSEGRYIDSSGEYALGLNSMVEYYAQAVRDGNWEPQAISKSWARYQVSSSIPENAVRAAVFASVSGLAAVDAIQCEQDELNDFDPRSRTMLLEYEQSEEGVYEVQDIDLNPAHNLNNSGILQITNLQDPVRDRKLRPGEF
jgi:hypothetical protein